MSKEGTQLERALTARQIRRTRSELDRKRDPGYIDGWDRGLVEYIESLGGISYFLDYLKRLDQGGVLLDIGSGTNRGVAELARTKIGNSFDIVATNLSRVIGSVQETGRVKVIRTSAEVLNGVQDQSISGIIAVASIAYSEAPAMVANTINRVLVPGGGLKAHFRPLGGENQFSQDFGYKTHHRFSSAFRALGYDVAIRQGIDEDVMVALKPGIEVAQTPGQNYTAESILQADNAALDLILLHERQL